MYSCEFQVKVSSPGEGQRATQSLLAGTGSIASKMTSWSGPIRGVDSNLKLLRESQKIVLPGSGL